MNDQKIENLLNLALDATENERERSLELDVGFDELTRTWEPVSYTHLLVQFGTVALLHTGMAQEDRRPGLFLSDGCTGDGI